MTNDFVTMLAGAALAFLLVFAGRHALKTLFGVVLPGWLMPAAIGLAMIGTAIWSEYSWFPRLRAGLPETAVVVLTGQETAPWRPWTYAVPLTVRAMVIDRAKLRAPAPGVAEADLLLLQRWAPMQTVTVAYDCAGARRADLFGGASVAADGSLSGATWQALDQGDAGLKAACLGG